MNQRPGYRPVSDWGGCLVSERASIYGENFEMGKNCRIDDNVVIVCGEGVYLGDYVHLGPGVTLHGGRIDLGEGVAIAAGTHVFTHSDNYGGGGLFGPEMPEDFKTTVSGHVVIGDHSIVGANTIILPGVTIGQHCAIGALSLVNRDVEPYAMKAGVPAKLIGYRDKRAVDDMRQTFNEWRK